jgi:hypothetical protein
MSTQEEPIRITVAIPLDLLPEIGAYAAAHKDEAHIEVKEMPSSDKSKPLAFDPITGTAIGWIALKFVGGLASKVAVGVLTKIIYEKLKERWQGKPRPVDVHLTTGESIQMDLTQPPDEAALEAKLKEST